MSKKKRVWHLSGDKSPNKATVLSVDILKVNFSTGDEVFKYDNNIAGSQVTVSW